MERLSSVGGARVSLSNMERLSSVGGARVSLSNMERLSSVGGARVSLSNMERLSSVGGAMAGVPIWDTLKNFGTFLDILGHFWKFWDTRRDTPVFMGHFRRLRFGTISNFRDISGFPFGTISASWDTCLVSFRDNSGILGHLPGLGSGTIAILWDTPGIQYSGRLRCLGHPWELAARDTFGVCACNIYVCVHYYVKCIICRYYAFFRVT